MGVRRKKFLIHPGRIWLLIESFPIGGYKRVGWRAQLAVGRSKE